jgi:hypothetical protein
MEMSGNALKFYNWGKNGDYIGSVGSLIQGNDSNKPIISLWNDIDSAVTIGYQSKTEANKIPAYVYFDKYGVLNSENTKYPISVQEPTKFYIPAFFLNSIKLGSEVVDLFGNGEAVCTSAKIYADKAILTNETLTAVGNVYGSDAYFSSIHVNGSKTRAVKTSVGTVAMNAFETPNPLFADYGHDKLDRKGLCTVFLDTLFLETVSLEEGYEVFLTKYGPGDIWVQERDLDSFLVCGDPGLKFSWNVVAKQKGYENVRMQKINEEEFNIKDKGR